MKQKKFCKICGAPHWAKGLCKRCYNRDRQQEYYKKHPEIREQRIGKWRARETCAILTKHHEEQKDNSQHLSTEFILQQIEELRKRKPKVPCLIQKNKIGAGQERGKKPACANQLIVISAPSQK